MTPCDHMSGDMEISMEKTNEFKNKGLVVKKILTHPVMIYWKELRGEHKWRNLLGPLDS